MIRRILLFTCALSLIGCASLMGDFDPPSVAVENVRSLPGEGGAPRFLITLRIVNPNKQSLDIVGISYSLEILGKRLISGVSNEIPRLEAYSEQTVDIEASVRLFELLRLFASLGMEPTDQLDYRLTAKIDFKGMMPTQRVEETGLIALK